MFKKYQGQIILHVIRFYLAKKKCVSLQEAQFKEKFTRKDMNYEKKRSL